MTKTTKLWISDKLELRWNEWPRDINPNAPEWAQEEFEQLLAKAKKESVCIPRVEFVNAITDRTDIKTGEAIEYIESNYNPDTFVDLPISITIDRDQVKCCRLDCLASMQGGKCKAEIIVKVARLKPVEKPEPDSIFTREDVREMKERIKELEQDNSEGFEKYQELLIQNRNLKERVKELEDFIADLYENVDPHEMQSKLHDFLTE